MSETSAIIPFSSPDYGTIRALTIDGEPWFVAKDVCDALGLSNVTEALRRLDLDEFSSTEVIDSVGRSQSTRIVSEPGLYGLVLSSRKPEAKAFQRWVKHDVLPAIRSHGGYLSPAKVEEALTDPDTIIRLAQSLKAERAARAELQRENETLRPRAALAESAIDLSGSMSLTEAARYLAQVDPAMTRKRLTALLRADGIVCQRGTAPTREGIDRGYVVQKLPSFRAKDGTMRAGAPYAHLTAKGLDWACRRYCAGARGEVA